MDSEGLDRDELEIRMPKVERHDHNVKGLPKRTSSPLTRANTRNFKKSASRDWQRKQSLDRRTKARPDSTQSWLDELSKRSPRIQNLLKRVEHDFEVLNVCNEVREGIEVGEGDLELGSSGTVASENMQGGACCFMRFAPLFLLLCPLPSASLDTEGASFAGTGLKDLLVCHHLLSLAELRDGGCSGCRLP